MYVWVKPLLRYQYQDVGFFYRLIAGGFTILWEKLKLQQF
jgi:hypothetical protein